MKCSVSGCPFDVTHNVRLRRGTLVAGLCDSCFDAMRTAVSAGQLMGLMQMWVEPLDEKAEPELVARDWVRCPQRDTDV